MHIQTALEEAVADGDAAKGLLQMERDSTALLAKARQAAVEVKLCRQACMPAMHTKTGILRTTQNFRLEIKAGQAMPAAFQHFM